MYGNTNSQPFSLVTQIDGGVPYTDEDLVSQYFNDNVLIIKYFPIEDPINNGYADVVNKEGVREFETLMKRDYDLSLIEPKILRGSKHCSGDRCTINNYLVFGRTFGTPSIGITTGDKLPTSDELASQDVEEISTTNAAGTYLTPYAFRIPKKKKKKKTNEGSCGYNRDVKSGKKLTTPGGLKEDKSENPGATLGPGPKAGPDGVEDSAYVKQFKYKLVPKDKKGNYVQKGSGLEVKNIF